MKALLVNNLKYMQYKRFVPKVVFIKNAKDEEMWYLELEDLHTQKTYRCDPFIQMQILREEI
jgi:hypothetical protein